jgi:hypothetical protein
MGSRPRGDRRFEQRQGGERELMRMALATLGHRGDQLPFSWFTFL